MTSRKKATPAPSSAAQGTKEAQPNEGGKLSKKRTEAKDSPGTEHVNAAPPPKPDNQAAVDFLLRMCPDGPWALTAIKVIEKIVAGKTKEVKDIRGRLFTKEQFTEMFKWIKEHNAKFNMYYGLNPVMREFNQKASREDIKEMAWLHVDIDARPPNPELSADEIAAHLKAEFARIYELLTAKLPAGVPPPTVIIFSGGGYQAFWKLTVPVPIDGQKELYEDAKLYNKQLERLFGGDNCHNVDRILRLPGSVNLPDAKKRKKGRKPALAQVVKFAGDIAYPLCTFVKAPPDNSQGGEHGDARDERFKAKAKRVKDVNELDVYGVDDRIKVVIVQGHHPELPKSGDNSRSSWLFDVLCHLYRKDVPEDLIYSIITDKGFGISASVLDKGGNAEKYGSRQMARAKDAVAADQDEPVAWVNQRYFAALEGGRIRFYREDKVGGRAALAMMNADAFTFELAPHSQISKDEKGNVKAVAYSKIWHFSSKRRYYRRGFVLDPMHGEHDEEYNLWRGFGIEPHAGDWSRMRAHIKEVLAAGNADYADYIIRWAAWALQNPATPPRVALVFRGAEGVGKGVFAYSLVKIFGDHGLRIQTMAHLTGKFNAHLRHLCMLFADEAVAPGDADGVGSLKGLITEPTVPIEAKGVDVVNADNHIHLIMSSNEKWVIPASINARRFAMFDVPDTRQGDREYFTALFNEIENGGLNAMSHELLTTDLSGWHPDSHRPETDALVEQKIRSLGGIEREWYNVLLMGELPIHDTLGGGFTRISTTDLLDYIQRRLRTERITANDLASLFGKEGMGFQREEAKRPRGYILPSLNEARARWNEKMFPVRWPETSTGWHSATIEPY